MPADPEGPYALVHSGVKFSLVDPDRRDVRLDDIVFSLTHINRFTGHADPPWSVLDHSLYVYRLAEHDRGRLGDDFAKALLLHDAAEAYVGDVSGPVKQVVPDFKYLEARVRTAIGSCFQVSFPIYDRAVTRYDLMALRGEAEMFMPDDRYFDQFPVPALEPMKVPNPEQVFRQLLAERGLE